MELEPICNICCVAYNFKERAPRILTICGHTLCSFCLSQIIANNESKCPFDYQHIDEKDINSFPVNFALIEFIQNKMDVKLCQMHQKEFSFVCVTEKIKICVDCYDIHEEKHHKIIRLAKIKTMVEEAKEEVSKLIENTRNYHKDLSYEFQQIYKNYIKLIKDEYQKMKDAIQRKEEEDILKTKHLFDMHKNMLDKTFGERSEFIERYSKLRSNLSYVSSHQEYFDPDSLNQLKIQMKASQSDMKLEVAVEQIKAEFNKLFKSFYDSFEDWRSRLPKVHLPHNANTRGAIILSSLEDKSAINSKSDFKCFTAKSCLNFKLTGTCLNITNQKYCPHDILVDLNIWSKINILEITLRYELSGDDLLLLTYIWNNLDKYNKLRLRFMNLSSANELSRISFKVPQTVQSLNIHVSKIKIGIEFASFIKRILLRTNNLKDLSITLCKTKIQSKSLADAFNFYSKNIENFHMDIWRTNIDVEDIESVFVEMPNLKNFRLDIDRTKITDKSLELCHIKTLSKTKTLENFIVRLNANKVTDHGIKRLLSDLKGIKKFELDLRNTNITDNTVLLLSEKLSDLATVEHFSLNFADTNITDQSIRSLFKPLPNVIYLELGFKRLNFSDKTLMIFADMMQVSMKNLQTLKLEIGETKITDTGIIKLMENIGDLKAIYLNFRNTRITDNGLKQFIIEKLPKLNKLVNFSINLKGTLVSKEVQLQLANYKKSSHQLPLTIQK